ncbi:diguanylate cyclase [Roseateles sp. DAIF2]|uniref:GGDEF domain-containing protein n=1 Tax=Roseateles sp. DAIF2 TaxID=2714952 RepID=UPI0018A28FB2|nr:diguanylate cyclase [Roseateles sp. DAIF2]QPF76171.1 diguanylate cyclase [Roseateles sp. DAIF2]
MRIPFSSLLARHRGAALPAMAPVLGLRHFGHGLLLAAALLLLPYALLGAPRPLADWRWMDVLGEGGMAALVAVWLAYLRASRPAGPVTDRLCLGMAGMLLGAYVDLLDEFWLLPKSMLWDNWLESLLTPLGMALLTWGLHLWRQEQLALARQLGPRERLFRDHRRIDALTQLGDAAYMAAQIALERQAGRPGQLLMLGWRDFDAALARRLGLAETDRLLQSAGLLLALQLRPDVLLCRYAGDRFVVLLPGAGAAEACAQAEQLRQALLGWPQGPALPVLLARAGTADPAEPEALLRRLAAHLRSCDDGHD